MRIKRKDANVVKICEASQVKVKTAGDTTVIQFCAGQNKKCPVQNLSKDTYLLKETGEIKPKFPKWLYRELYVTPRKTA